MRNINKRSAQQSRPLVVFGKCVYLTQMKLPVQIGRQGFLGRRTTRRTEGSILGWQIINGPKFVGDKSKGAIVESAFFV